jgi:enolase
MISDMFTGRKSEVVDTDSPSRSERTEKLDAHNTGHKG